MLGKSDHFNLILVFMKKFSLVFVLIVTTFGSANANITNCTTNYVGGAAYTNCYNNQPVQVEPSRSPMAEMGASVIESQNRAYESTTRGLRNAEEVKLLREKTENLRLQNELARRQLQN